MKRLSLFILPIFVFALCQNIFAEIAVINRIVYGLDVGDLTASVLNFQTSTYEQEIITIPAQVVYKGEVYKVDGFCHNNFDYDALREYSKEAAFWGVKAASIFYDLDEGLEREKRYRKFKYDYSETRANIVELYLPSSITYVGSGAFAGMTRLKSITIPKNAQVADNGIGIFGRNERLENIVFEGIPHLCYSYRNGKIENGIFYARDTICFDQSNNPLAVLDSLELKTKLKERCPRLKTIEFLPLNDYISYKNKMDKMYTTYSQKLKDSVEVYSAKLKQHPYYFYDTYFKDIVLTQPILNVNRAKESYSAELIALKKNYTTQLALCREQFKTLYDTMEVHCKNQDPDTYAKKYISYHPEFSIEVDSFYNDYKCTYTKEKLAVALLSDENLGVNCKDYLWRQYGYLYKSKDDFMSTYDNAADIYQELDQREHTYNSIKQYFYREWSYQNIQGCLGKKDKYDGFLNSYRKMKRLNIPITKYIIEIFPKAHAEYDENGSYFSNAEEFFDAYLSPDYKKLLNAKKSGKGPTTKVATTPSANPSTSQVKENTTSKSKPINIENLDEQTKIDMYYLAYLIKVQLFNTRYKKEMRENYNEEYIQKLVDTYSDKELKAKSKGHSKQVGKYRM